MGNIREEWLMKALEMRFDWLNDRADGWQFGEAGVLEACCDRLGIKKGVEIGAGDGGKDLPLTLSFLYDRGDRLALYEQDELRQIALRQVYPRADIFGRWSCYGSCNEFQSIQCLDACVVIDVDSFDWKIAESLVHSAKPPLLMVEHFDSCHPCSASLGLPPDWLLGKPLAEGGFAIQATWPEMQKRMRYFGYTLTARSRVNSLYVRDDLLPALEG